MRQDVPALGRKAAELTFNRITGEQSQPAHVVQVTVVPGQPPVEADPKRIGSAVADGVATDPPEVK
ncbi:MAG: hypothetical protein ABIQ18_13665 [Umezawaea sp.]